MLARFLDLEAGAAFELRGCLDRGTLREAQRLAHSMASAAGTIGAAGLEATARDLEDALGQDRADPSLVNRFETALAEVIACLQAHLR